MILMNYVEPGWGIFPELRRIQNEMNRLFNGSSLSPEEYPAVNLYSSEDNLVLTAEIPGISAEDIGITVEGNVLTIEGEKKPLDAGEEAVFYSRERGFGKFVRNFRLPFEVDDSRVSAKYADGVLALTMPRAEASKPRKIKVN